MWLDASWNTSSQAKPISIKLQNKTTNQTLDGPVLTLTGVRLTGLMVKSFFLRTLDLGIATFADSLRHTVRRCNQSLTQVHPSQEFLERRRWTSRPSVLLLAQSPLA